MKGLVLALKYVDIKVADKSHICLKNPDKCHDCENKPCTHYCPTGVFYWDKHLNITYEHCIECGACPFGCPFNNIIWTYPPGGYGVEYHS